MTRRAHKPGRANARSAADGRRYEVIKHSAGHSALIGYARVSTVGQSLAAQVELLKSAGCARVYCETVSGAAKVRPAFDAMFESLVPGDVVAVCALDRLGRKFAQLVRTLDRIRDAGAHFRDLRHGINTAGPQGRLLLHMLMAMAEAEREMVQERTREGMREAARNGRHPGRPTVLEPAKLQLITHLRAKRYTHRQIADELNISRTTVAKALDLCEDKADPRQTKFEGIR